MAKAGIHALFILSMLTACNRQDSEFDAQGTFEAEEVLVSPEAGGRILSLEVEEGDSVMAGAVVGRIDDTNLSLQRQQVEESIAALRERTSDAAPQVLLLERQLAVQQAQAENLTRELSRAEGLLAKDAATSKQVDDLRYQLEAARRQMAVTRQQVAVQRTSTANQNRAVMSEAAPLQKKAEQLGDLAARTRITNPVTGTVITRYAKAGEMAVPGKPLYKVADLRTLTLRAYVSGAQLAGIRVGQPARVFVDAEKGGYREIPGRVTWISPKAEFTPKTIQTKDERANLVYALKVVVSNDGALRIGMYGEIKF